MSRAVSVFWFRRDLRLYDNTALYHALKSGDPVLPLFIFDTDILDGLTSKQDRRLCFIHDTILQLQQTLIDAGSSLQVYFGKPVDCFKKLKEAYNISAVYTNHDYEPYATERDSQVAALLQQNNIAFYSFKDQVIFEKNEIVKDYGKPHTVFTPYSKKWKAALNDAHLKQYPSEKYLSSFYKRPPVHVPSLNEMGFEAIDYEVSPPVLDIMLAAQYDKTRDIPAVHGTTRLGVHLRFGTVSIRHLVAEAKGLNEILLNEFIWREFFQMILWHFPYVVSGSFRKEYDKIQWRNSEREFEAWCKGQTGYPIVDAGMRELNATGFMHNRVRMIVASFLTKHLLIDWRWGEAYFAEKLLDYELASNNGNWQWAAGTGCDAAPYFRIFNPHTQTEKFDPQFMYIKKWVPEWNTANYTKPIVEHATARARCLEAYKKALTEK